MGKIHLGKAVYLIPGFIEIRAIDGRQAPRHGKNRPSLQIGLTPSIPETDGTLLKSSIAPPYSVEDEKGELPVSRLAKGHEERAS
jgi:hypothetical protein